MKASRLATWMLAAVLTLPLWAVSCDDGGGDGGSEPAVNVTGQWRILPSGETTTSLMRLAQNGEMVTGTVDGRPATGTVEGHKITLTFADADTVITLKGEATETEMNGTWRTNEGESGTWVGTKL